MEMALVLPLLLMLLLGIFATARGWQVHNVLDHAAREGARYGATVDPWDGSSENAVRGVAEAQISAASIPTGSLTWCIDQGSAPCGSTAIPDSEQVVVQITYPDYELDFLFFSMTVDLQANAFARYES